MIIEGVKAMNRKDHVKSLEILTEAKSVAEKNNWHKQTFLALNNIGANYYTMLDYGEALNNYLAAYTIALKNLDEESKMTVLNNIALLYLKEKQFDKAEEYLLIAYNVAKRKKVLLRQGIYAVNLGMVNNEKKNYSKALLYLNEARSLIGEKDALRINVDLALSDNLLYRGEVQEAKKSALRILSSISDKESNENIISLYLLLSRISEAENDLTGALNFAAKALNSSNSPETSILAYEALTELYTKAGKYNQALALKDSLIKAIKELNNIKNGRQFENNRVKFEIADYRNKLIQNNEKLVAQRRSFLIILAFALVVIVLITWALRISTIKNRQRKALALLEQEKLKNELENKNRKLAAKALHDNEWETFLTHFEEVNHKFLQNLREKHPDLNSNDIRFISYVYINLSTKEIALMLNITPEACRKRRERISRKLGLSENSDLYEYISGL